MSAYQDENYVTSQVVGGMFVVSSGCIAASTLISGGVMYVESGGIAKDSVLDEYGTLVVLGGGLVENTVVSNGTLNIEGGTHCGKLWIGDEGRVFGGYDRPASIDFTIAGQEAGEDYLINDLSRIDGYITYSVVAASDQTVGIYKLARNADSFFNCGLRVGDTEVERLLTVDNQIEYAGKLYQLTLADDALTLTVSQSANMAPVMIYRSGAVISSGTVISGAVISGDNTSMFVTNGGKVDASTVSAWGAMQIFSGGTANNTIVSGARASVYVLDGGIASGTDVRADGELFVSSGGMVEKTSVRGLSYSPPYFGELHVSSGGIAVSTTVSGGGKIDLQQGGIARGTVVSKSGHMRVSEGGEAFDTIVWAGGVIGGFCFSEQRSFSHIGGGMQIIGANVSVDISNRRLKVGSGGVLSGASADFYAVITVDSGGIVSNTTLNDTESFVVFGGGRLVVSSGGRADSTTVENRGWIMVTSGGRAYNTTVSSGGVIGGFSFETSKFFEVIDDDSILLEDNVELNVAGRNMSVFDGGTVNRVTVVGGALLNVESGGRAVATVLEWNPVQSGHMNVNSGGVAIDTEIEYGSVRVRNGGVASNTSIGDDNTAMMYVESGGLADGVGIGRSGGVHVSSGGIVRNAVVSGSPDFFDDEYGNPLWGIYGSMCVSGGGHVYNTVLDGGQLYVHGGTASGVTVTSEGARIDVRFGGTVCDADLSADFGYYGDMRSISIDIGGGFAVNTRLGSGAAMGLLLGTASNTIVNSGGGMYISRGGVHRGTLQIESGAVVSARSGAEIDFTVAERTTEDDYLINDLSLIRGTPTYTITVSAGQSAGVYKLAQGAENFTGTISIGHGSGIDSVNYGTLTVNGAGLDFGSKHYALVKDSGRLDLSITEIDTVPPVKPTAVADITAITNQNVTVTASFANDAVLNEYSLNGGTWTEYTAGIVFTENGSVSFRSTDAAGNVSNATVYTVTNIDKIAPEDPVAVADITAPTNGSVTVTASFAEDSMLNEYSLNGGAWTEYTEGIVFTENGSVSFRSTDAAGNISENTEYVVANIDKVVPVVPVLSGNAFGVNWSGIDAAEFTVEYSANSFATALSVSTTGIAVDHYGMPTGTYQWRVNDIAGDDITATGTATAQLLQSDADGDLDVFFAVGKSTWRDFYFARHDGALGGWGGTGEEVKLQGKNQLTDIFAGSDDANILVMTDDANGDALFLDDIFSESPADVQQARIARIKEIRAGAGDDLVDLTSQRFAYVGAGVTVYGGSGDDTIWANSGSNRLFGDAGNDRLVGASGDDVIVGGAGNDSMQGGGGNDIFTFGADWGVDTVEQLASGTVTLWFESGSMANWDEAARIYSDGLNSVTVAGTAEVTLKFGGDASSLPAGVFSAAASEKIFEDKSKGLLA